MILSIIVISHNQKEELKRCLMSILSQSLPFEFEIIISDDNSNDGSWEVAQEFASCYPQISAYSCNTNDFHPANTSERSGWNRCNGYKHATGKYIAHIDGDDFLLEGTDIYKKQVELLEKNPNCSCCMANDYDLDEGQDISKIKIRHKKVFQTGDIHPSEEYIKHFFRESHCFVYRRQEKINPVELYGGYYVDSLITDHHIQFGDIICLNDAGYVYVHYQSSIWSQQKKKKDHIVFAHAIYMAILIPKWKYVFRSTPRHLGMILNVVRLAQSGYRIREDNLHWIQRFDCRLYHSFNRDLSFTDKMYLSFLAYYIRVLRKTKPSFKLPYKLLSSLI